MKMFKTDEEAVSPVIGVILMVAIVVILAAVIAAFVFGMAGGTGTAKNIGMTVQADSSGASLTLQGGADLPQVTKMEYNLNGTSNWYVVQTTGGSSAAIGDFTVGTVLKAPNQGTNLVQGARLMIRGTFTDGSQQVIFDRRY